MGICWLNEQRGGSSLQKTQKLCTFDANFKNIERKRERADGPYMANYKYFRIFFDFLPIFEYLLHEKYTICIRQSFTTMLTFKRRLPDQSTQNAIVDNIVPRFRVERLFTIPTKIHKYRSVY